MFRLCVVISDLGAGGSQRVLINLLPFWQKKYRVTIITLADSSQDFFALPANVERRVIGGIKYSSNKVVGFIANLKRIFSLRREFRLVRPHIILSFICHTNLLTIFAAFGLKTHVVISERNDPLRQSFGRIWDKLRKYCYRFADCVTANSKGALQTMQAYVPIDKLYFVPNPVVIESSNQHKLTFDAPTILAVGRLHPQKGYDILLAAFAKFVRHFPKWQLAILGMGPLKNFLETIVENLGIQSSVKWYGNIKNPAAFYRAASIFVLSSRYEGTPNALLEAMSYGLPVIVTTASSGALEYVEHQKSGIVVEAENVEALFEALLIIAKDEKIRKTLAMNAVEKIKSSSIEHVVQAWENVLEKS